jgi:predicted nucleotidyltransferase
MNFDVDKRTILRVISGSKAYGTSLISSDTDIKGVCIEPKNYFFGFLNKFEQSEELVSKGHSHDKVIFSLIKFANLAINCNPNIIEILNVEKSDILYIDEFGEELRSMADEFLSKKARYSFAGYAHSQLNRIKLHRKFLFNPITKKPERKDFGLDDSNIISNSEMGAYDSLNDQGIKIEIPKQLLTVFTREKQYRAAVEEYKSYQDWLKNRNPERAKMEAAFNFDGKHALHLVRLSRMGKEILETHKVIVKRPDAEDLLAIRLGKRSYESILEEVEKIEADCERLYQTSTLRYEPDRVAIDKKIQSIIERYLSKNG